MSANAPLGWRGGRGLETREGEVLLTSGPGHRALEHRVVMARILDRPLTSREQVPHLNGVRHDHRPGPLVLSTPTTHDRRTLITAMERRILFGESCLRDYSPKSRLCDSGTTPTR